MRTPLQWAIATFGQIARNRDERAARLLEEVIEFAQAENVPKDVALRLVEHVYSKPAGNSRAELAAVCMTLDAVAENVGISIEEEASREFDRVRRVPREEWERRHNAKVNAGRANLSPVRVA